SRIVGGYGWWSYWVVSTVFDNRTSGVAALAEGLGGVAEEGFEGFGGHFVLVAADEAAAAEEFVPGPHGGVIALDGFLGLHGLKAGALGGGLEEPEGTLESGKFAEALELADGVVLEVFVADGDDVGFERIGGPGFDVFVPFAGRGEGVVGDELEEVKGAVFEGLAVMEKGNHGVASVAEQIDDAAVFGYGERVRLEEHGRGMALVPGLVMDVGDEVLDEGERGEFGHDAVDGAGDEFLDPGVAGLGIADDEDVIGGEFGYGGAAVWGEVVTEFAAQPVGELFEAPFGTGTHGYLLFFLICAQRVRSLVSPLNTGVRIAVLRRAGKWCEGVGMGDVSQTSPHPDPLPRGEGTATGDPI